MIKSLIISLVLTEIVELTLAIIFGVKGKINIIIVILANIVTNLPIVFTMNMLVGNVSKVFYFVILIVLEVFVLLIEGFIYDKLRVESKFSGYKLSCILNIVTTLIGLLLHIIDMWGGVLWKRSF